MKRDQEKILEEILVEDFPKMGKEIATIVQETQSLLSRSISTSQPVDQHLSAA